MTEGGCDCPNKAMPASPSPPKNVALELFNSTLWSTLADLVNEMEVSGALRKLVPEMIIKVSGLVEDLEYTLSVMFVPIDDNYYLYQDHTWVPGRLDVDKRPETVYWHPNGKMTGREWSSQFIRFPDIRLTTDPDAVPPKMFVVQWRWYQTVIVFTGGDSTSVLKLPELRFMAVSWIQNPQVRELKARKREKPPPKMRRVTRRTSDKESSSQTPSQRTQPQEDQRPSAKNSPTPTPQNDSETSVSSSPMLTLSGRQSAETSCILPPLLFLTSRDVPRKRRPSTSAHDVTSSFQPPPSVMGPNDLSRDLRPRMGTLSAHDRTSCIQPLPPVIASSEVSPDLRPQTADFPALAGTSSIQPACVLASSDRSRDLEPQTDPVSELARTSCILPAPSVLGNVSRDIEPRTGPFPARGRTSCIMSTPRASSDPPRNHGPRAEPFVAQPTTVTSYSGYVIEDRKSVIVSSTTCSTEDAQQLPGFSLQYAAVEETRSSFEVPDELAASSGTTSEETHSQSAAACAHAGEPSHSFHGGPSQAFVQHPGALDLAGSALWDVEDYVPETDHNQ